MRTLLVEDEPPARHYLRELLADDPGIAVVGEAATGVEGTDMIRALAPDLVFLDVQMPALDGFGLVDAIGIDRMPAFIFVTAYQEHAVRAFEIAAIDYVCKPFDRDRLALALQRARRYLRLRQVWSDDDTGLDTGPAGDGQWLTRVMIKNESAITFVPTDRILWIEAANKYVVMHTEDDGTHVARQTIQSLASQLDPASFVRTHRAIVIRKSAIRGLQPAFHGDYVVTLASGKELPLSRTFRESFFSAMSR